MERYGFKRYIFVLPAIVFILSFMIYPLIYNLNLSFKDVTLITFIRGTSEYIGLSNYMEVISDPTFQRAALNTLIFTVASIFFQFVIGFLIALLFNKEFPLRNFLISLLMLPWFIPILVSGTIFKFFLSDLGFINNVLLSLKLIKEPIPFITNSNLALYSLVFVNVWLGIPFNFILLYTGLKGIPLELYESAEIDGATSWKKVWFITIPMLKPVIITTLMLGAIFTIKVFDLVWIITKGGPGNSSHLFSTYSYLLAFGNFKFGLGAAVSTIMLLVIVIVVGIFNIIKVED
ncbi:MAG: multiple sugar transport system permease protein [Thermotogaceae bacterium]|jgi:multiple sugar transport system permease protein|nr:multiple sugar transport system permease protein [Thermosipho sp. (in: thermotogales)]MDN5337704.1 multiple sugar transport system permease protein [Thermotogaceae bacterium]